MTREILPLWLNGYSAMGIPTHNFYEIPGEDVLIIDWGSDDVWIGSSEQEVKQFIHPGLSETINPLQPTLK